MYGAYPAVYDKSAVNPIQRILTRHAFEYLKKNTFIQFIVAYDSLHVNI